MASNPSRGEHRLSFAKVAAMPPRSKLQPSVAPDAQNEPPSSARLAAAVDSDSAPNGQEQSRQNQEAIQQDLEDLNRSIAAVQLSDSDNAEGDSGRAQENELLRREASFEDDSTNLSTSSTKPASLDSKSMASVTTFAMDEKDSLRPDDSASVQAIDEMESLSGPASAAPESRTGSDAGVRGIRDIVIVQRARELLSGADPVYAEGADLSNGANNSSISNGIGIPNSGVCAEGRSPYGFPLEPDEKLLEAMKSPKDRLLILQLEEKIRHFIQESKEQSLELPPSNAFGRLLAHKLGDYYHLTHFVDNNVTSVRLHRTPFCRLPTPLSARFAATADIIQPPLPAMKIMRRSGPNGDRPSTEGSTATSSAAPSKTTSEAGESGNDGERTCSSAGATPAKDRMTLTREEREAKYQEARERIFRDFPESKMSDSVNGDQSANVSRSSSASGRKKAYRQRTPHDDSFEARSQFSAYYPTAAAAQYTNGSTPYTVPMHESSYAGQPPYVVGPGVSSPTGSYTPTSQNGPIYPGHGNPGPLQQYPVPASPQMSQNGPWLNGAPPQQPPYSGYPPMTQSQPMMGHQSSVKSSPAMSNYATPNNMHYQQAPTNWSPPQYQGNYPQSPGRGHPPISWPAYPSQPMAAAQMPYSYGQYPGSAMHPGMNPMLPSSANSHATPSNFAPSPFNPQTRSFIPGGGSPRHAGKIGQPGVNQYPGPNHNPPNQWVGYYQDFNSKSCDSSSSAGQMPGRGGSAGGGNSIAKWGTPAHLPPKPPPSQVPSEFGLSQRNASQPSRTFANNPIPVSQTGPLVVSGGASSGKSN